MNEKNYEGLGCLLGSIIGAIAPVVIVDLSSVSNRL